MKPSFRSFFIIWIGQLFSIIGSSLTYFGIGVWVLLETGSVTQFSLIMMFASVPAILVSPFAGVVIDRFKRKWIMLASDTMAALGTLAILLLLYIDRLEIWHIFIAAAIVSLCGAFQAPAYMSAISVMVPKDQLNRANGMVQLADGMSGIIAPLAGGFLLGLIGIEGIILIDLSAFLVAATTLIFTKIKEIDISKEKSEKISIFQESLYGWRYIMERPGLKGFLIYFAISNLLLGFYNVLLQPMILSFTNEKVLGTILSFSGVGMFIGGIVVSVWKGPKKRILPVIFSGLAGGIFLSFTGIFPSPIVVGIGTFVLMFFLPIANSSSQGIWQSKVAPSVQGRVFSFRRMVAVSLSPVAYVTAGPLVDYVFEPFMAGNSGLAGFLQSLIGSGEGRGIGLLFILIGLLWALTTLVIILNPKVLHIETDLPDELDQDVPAKILGN